MMHNMMHTNSLSQETCSIATHFLQQKGILYHKVTYFLSNTKCILWGYDIPQNNGSQKKCSLNLNFTHFVFDRKYVTLCCRNSFTNSSFFKYEKCSCDKNIPLVLVTKNALLCYIFSSCNSKSFLWQEVSYASCYVSCYASCYASYFSLF